MRSSRTTVLVFKILELVLSIVTAVAVIVIEIVSSDLRGCSCFVIVGICGMVCFLSLAFICSYCRRHTFSRPALLLAAGIGAFLFFALALYQGIEQFSSNATLLASVVFALCLGTALVLYIDAVITYCGGPDGRGREETREAKEWTKAQPSEQPETLQIKPKKSIIKERKSADRDPPDETTENGRPETFDNRFGRD